MKVSPVAAFLGLVLALFTVLGIDSTGSAVAATVSSDDPNTGPNDVISYVDSNGVTRTVPLQGSALKTTYVTPSYKDNITNSPITFIPNQNALATQCAEEQATGTMPLAGVAICATLFAAGMAGSALGWLGQWLQLPLGWTPDLEPVGGGPVIPGCPVTLCVGGYFDEVTKVWFRNLPAASEKYGLINPSVTYSAAGDPQITIVAHARFPAGSGTQVGGSGIGPMLDGTSGGSVFRSNFSAYCSDGTVLARVSGNTTNGPGRSTSPSELTNIGNNYYSWRTSGTFTLSGCNGRGGVAGIGWFVWPTTSTTTPYLQSYYVAEEVPEPESNLRATTTCTDAAGVQTVVETVVTFDFEPGSKVRIPDTVCPPGSAATDHGLDYEKGGSTAPILPEGSTAPVPNLGENLAENMECYDGTKTCKLELRQANGEPCGTNARYCPTWASDPNAPDNYKCFYNSKVVHLDQCSKYRAPDMGPVPDVDKDGNRIPYTAPPPGDLTEIPEEQVPELGSGGESDTPEGRECFPTGWNVLNPVEWVMKPVGCAIQKAFVPSEAVVQGHLDRAVDAWSETAPYQLMDAVTGWQFVPPPAGCNGIAIDVYFIPVPLHVMSACEGDFLAPVAEWARIFGTIGFIAFGVIGVTRNVARIFSFPGIGGDSA